MSNCEIKGIKSIYYILKANKKNVELFGNCKLFGVFSLIIKKKGQIETILGECTGSKMKLETKNFN